MAEATRAPRRRPTRLSLDPELVTEARQLGPDLSRAAEAGIRRAVATEETRRWIAENPEAVRDIDAHVEKHGLPLAKYRMF